MHACRDFQTQKGGTENMLWDSEVNGIPSVPSSQASAAVSGFGALGFRIQDSVSGGGSGFTGFVL